jgi:hypothetical protein
MGLLPPVVAEFKADTQQFVSKLGEVGDRVEKLGKAGESTAERMKAAIGGHLTAVGGFATVAGAALEHLGQQSEAAKVQLETAMKNAGFNYDEFKGRIDSAISSQERFGHTGADTQAALAKMTTAFQDPNQALKDMSLAADIAAVKHISLADASDLVVKATMGNAKAFKQFGIDVATTANPMDELTKRLSGQAAAAADTFGGKIAALRAHITDMAAGIGEKVGPALTMLGPLLMGVGQIASMAGPKIMELVGTFGPFALGAAAVGAALLVAKSASDKLAVSLDDLKTKSVEQIAAQFQQLQANVTTSMVTIISNTRGMSQANTEHAASLIASNRVWKDWSGQMDVVLQKAPGLAPKLIEAATAAGLSAAQVAELTKRMDDNTNATVDASVASGDYAAKVQALKEAKTAEATAVKQAAQDEAAAAKQMVSDGDKLAAAYQKSLKAVTDAYSGTSVAIMQMRGASTDQLTQLAADAKTTDTAVSGGFKSMTDIVSAFGDQTNVTAKQVDKFFKDQVKAAEEWSGNLTALAKAGLDDGLLQQLAAAGPKAAGLAKGMLADIKANGVDSINSAAASIKQITDITANSLKDASVLATFKDAGKAAANAWASGMSGLNSDGVFSVGFSYNGALSGGMKGVKAYADGGWVDAPPGAAVPAVVHGGEFVLSQSMLANMGASGGSSAPVINLNVNVSPTADSTEVGRQIVMAIKQYERSNSAQWRNSLTAI